LELNRLSQRVCKLQLVAKWAEAAWGPFIAPQGNLPIGVSEIQTCPSWGPDMSGNHLWNPTLEPDKFGSRDLTWDRAERPDICGLGVGHIRDIAAERKLRPGHIRAGGWTCSAKDSRNWSKGRICPVYLGILVCG
jgi:hypothetical protein